MSWNKICQDILVDPKNKQISYLAIADRSCKWGEAGSRNAKCKVSVNEVAMQDKKPDIGCTFGGQKYLYINECEPGLYAYRKGGTSAAVMKVKSASVIAIGNDGTSIQECTTIVHKLKSYVEQALK
ncbi:uncharacterized protein LOC143448995 [Clavelina lepadiformis]|uniref:uncharacterized protein LOC143448995 n=1 Tax=Clavelina lepadiformis TaxID=159417 RepID=UPI004042A4EA